MNIPPMARSPRHLRLLHDKSLRARLTVAATGAGVVGLAVGAVLMVGALERALLGSLDDSAASNARDIAALIDADRLGEGDPLPSYGAAVAQVVDASGTVIASTPGGDRLSPIVNPDEIDRVRGGSAITLDGNRLGEPDPYRVVGAAAGPPEDPQTVLVAVSLAQQQRSSTILRIGIIAAGVTLTPLLALASWFLVGRALRPVERLRSGAADISGAGRLERLPVPDAHDEIHRLATTLNDMLGRLESASLRQRAFISDAAHELRSPIAALRTQLEVSLAHPELVDGAEAARESLVEVDRMGRLVDDLLVLARLDETDRDMTRQTVDLQQLAADAAAQTPNPRVPITVVDGKPADVHGDERALNRVLRNLIDNAVRHASSAVSVQVERYASTVEVTVTDDGPGVPVADRTRIFERFARLDDARSRDAGGTGLGLAIVREIVRAHNARVLVEDAGPGARFVVRFPTPPLSVSG